MRPIPFEPLDPGTYRELVRRALAEDFGWGDVTTETLIDRDQKAKGIILVKSPCVLAGLDIALEAFRQLDSGVSVTCHRKDGDTCEPGTVVCDFVGHAAPMLTAERTALNFLQQLSGIASRTRAFVDAAAGRITILDTRKTTPGLRILEKYAVRVGGGTNHRVGLYDAILIKDNHVRLAGGVKAAIARTRRYCPGVPVEVEAETLLLRSLLEGRDEVPQQDLPHWVEYLAVVAAARGDACRAASLWGATEALFETHRLEIGEESRQVRARYGKELEASIGSAPEAVARGRSMTVQQAVDYALLADGPSPA